MFHEQPEKARFLLRAGIETKVHQQSKEHSSTIRKSRECLEKGAKQFAALDLAAKQAKNIKWKAIEQLDKLLERFEEQFIERGGKVFWAEDTTEALAFVSSICEEKDARTVVKTKSSVLEEIDVATHLRKKGIQVTETDLGDYILQLTGEAPAHMINSALHKNQSEVTDFLRAQIKASAELPLAALIDETEKHIKMQYRKADIGITGGNFIIADEGAIAFTENEGNIRLTTAFPKTHIAVLGIEKVLTNLHDLALFWPLLSTYAEGKRLAPYNSLVYGPRQAGETDGPEDMYVILIDNGRTELLLPEIREALYCIRCGACLNRCPVYQNIGGQAYETAYKGPIGAVITPHMKDMHAFGHLSFATTGCGNGADICPVHIDLQALLMENRHLYVAGGNGSLKEKMAWRLFKRGMVHRSILNTASGKMKTFVFEKLFGKAWGSHRSPLIFPEKTFNQLWKKQHKHHPSGRRTKS